MKKLFHILKDKARRIGDKISGKAMQARAILSSSSGEGYVDTAVKILMAVVIGALLLAGLYALFSGTVMPTLVQRIKDMFNYAG